MLVSWEAKGGLEPSKGLLGDRVNHTNNWSFQAWAFDYVSFKMQQTVLAVTDNVLSAFKY